MSISDETVEELVSVLRGASPDRYRPPTLREMAQAVVESGYGKLEPVATNMLGDAWEQGQRAWEDELLGKSSGSNPYRSKLIEKEAAA